MAGKFLVVEDPTEQDHLKILWFRDEAKFWEAVKILTETQLRFALIHLDSLLKEVLSRIEAWDKRRAYTVKTTGDEVERALTKIRDSNLVDEVPANAARADASNATEIVVSQFLAECPDFPNTPEAIKALAAKLDDMWGLLPAQKD
jgi:hypothetical protein